MIRYCRILVTGSRDHPDPSFVWKTLYEFTKGNFNSTVFVIVHGGCPTGVDKIAHDFAVSNNMQTEVYPADWSLGGKAGPVRNQRMVDTKPDLVLGFPYGESRGTRGCLRMARKAGLSVHDFEV